MLRRLTALFRRYSDRHLIRRGPAQRLGPLAARRDPPGHIDRIAWQNGEWTLSGWARGRQVVLSAGTRQATAFCTIARPDVAAAFGGDLQTGFQLSLRQRDLARAARPALSVQDAKGQVILTQQLRTGSLWIARARVAAVFAAALARALPDGIRWLIRRDPAHRAAIKRRLDLETAIRAQPLDGAALGAPAPAVAPADGTPVTLLMPVYNAYDMVTEALECVPQNTDLPWQIVLVEDGSTDPRIRPALRAWVAAQNAAQPDRAILIEQPQNTGFIGAVNTGLARAAALGHDVVLLNSDAFVPPRWASRLLAPLRADPSVASVTPMSNDAEIFSAPTICHRTPLLAGQAAQIDAVARMIAPALPLPALPTGMGFCMALSAAWLKRLPQLDTAFGRGYGEEVDWCRKTRAMGARHLPQPGLFVEHRGGESFGSETKRALVAQNNQLIETRYPGYDAEVQRFIADDPLITPRLALALAWAGSLGPRIPLYLAHSMGGGAHLYLERRIARDLEAGLPSVILRVGGAARWHVELAAPGGRSCGTTDDFALITRLLAPLGARDVIYSCGVGDADPVSLPARLADLAEGPDHRLEIEFHDYFPLAPSYTLLDAQNRFDPAATDILPGQARRPDCTSVDGAAWRAAWAPCLARADRLTTFSQASRRLVAAAYPDLAAKIATRPHDLHLDIPRLSPPPGPRNVAVLGAIGLAKGGGVLADLARHPGMPPLMVLGEVDPALPLPSSIAVHGRYDLADLPDLVAQYGITDWLIPSIWPETFSYTTHEALATGLPVHAFAIGAQGDAVAAAPNGHPVPWAPDTPATALARHLASDS